MLSFAGYNVLIKSLDRFSFFSVYVHMPTHMFVTNLVSFFIVCLVVVYVSKYPTISGVSQNYAALNKKFFKGIVLFVMAGLAVSQVGFMYRVGSIVASLMTTKTGAHLERVISGSVGFPYALQKGDVITAVNEILVKNNTEVTAQCTKFAGETVSVEFIRDQEELETQLQEPDTYPNELVGLELSHKVGLEHTISQRNPTEISLTVIYHVFISVVLIALWCFCAYFIGNKSNKWYFVSIVFGVIFIIARLVGG
jgi:membrane-associated protease RseP (regulator of RpoE activity)